MKSRICRQCNEKKGAQVTLTDFPIEDYHWCSDRCLFIWICKHDLRFDEALCTQLERTNKKTKKKEQLFMNDIIELSDMKQS